MKSSSIMSFTHRFRNLFRRTQTYRRAPMMACLEPLESRVLLATVAVGVDPDGVPGTDNSIVMTSLDWNVGNGLAVEGNTAVANFLAGAGSVTFQDYIQESLSVFNIEGGGTAGLPGTSEWTLEVGIPQIVTSVVAGPTAFFALDPSAGPAENFVRIFYDPTADSSDLAGTGFGGSGDAVMIMEAEITSLNSLFSTLPGGGAGNALDQFGADDYPGIDTVNGFGVTTLDALVTFFDSAFFTLDPGLLLHMTLFNTSQILPFNQVDPSALFSDSTGAAVIPSLGTVNGAVPAPSGPGGPDVQFQVDANQSFEVLEIPEVEGGIDIEKFVKQVPNGGEGLTPGFWKQEQHFDAWTNYLPSDKYDEVFGVDAPDDLSLLEALQAGGGGVYALMRHSTAALLNAANPNVDYEFDEAQVIAMVQDAFNTGDFEGIKNLFEAENELGADLNDNGPVDGPANEGFGEDADDPPGPTIRVGEKVMFTYVVTNTGDVQLADIVVIDDNETPGDTSDDFAPDPVEEGGFNVGDIDMDDRLDVDETWLFTSMREAEEGQHTDIGSVLGTPVDEQGNRVGDDVSDSDPANYFGEVVLGGGQGLTPGFWKQEQHFAFWIDYATGDSYNEVFGVDAPDNLTLLEALQAEGGGAYALMRHSVAALLNAANPDVDYLFDVSDVISIVQNAFATGDFEDAKDILEAQNELGGVDLND